MVGERSSEYVTDPKERMAKWKRRSDSLVKQARELSILCDTPVCIVITCPNNDDQSDASSSSSSSSRFVVWPNHDSGASLRRMINMYKAAQPKNKKPNNNNKNSTSSSSTVNVNGSMRANKKLKINATDDHARTAMVPYDGALGLPILASSNVGQQQQEEAAAGSLLKMLTSSSKSVDEAKNALVAVDTHMEQVAQSRIDEMILERKRKRPVELDDIYEDYGWVIDSDDDVTDNDEKGNNAENNSNEDKAVDATNEVELDDFEYLIDIGFLDDD